MDEQKLLTSTEDTVIENVVLLGSLSSQFHSYEKICQISNFPLEIEIKASNYLSSINLKLRMGLDASSNDQHTFSQATIPERLTVKKL